LLYSFMGTFIAIFSSGLMFYLVGLTPLSVDFSWKEAFAFGSLISATDPVSVLAIFKEMDADVHLYSIIFGESIFNDAVAIVMYEIVMKIGDRSLGEELVAGVIGFFIIFVGSLLIGAGTALVTGFVLKRQQSYLKDLGSGSSSQREQSIAA
jgi:sodium/hydrogen exchanger 8